MFHCTRYYLYPLADAGARQLRFGVATCKKKDTAFVSHYSYDLSNDADLTRFKIQENICKHYHQL